MGERRKLGSWKEIAAHLGCTVRSAQRWEKDDGLPVRRGNGDRRHRVFAYTDELDAWMSTSTTAPTSLPSAMTPLLPVETPAPASIGSESPTGPPDSPVGEGETLRSRFLLWLGLPMAVTAGILVVVFSTQWGSSNPLHHVEIEGNILIGEDRAGHELWRRTFPRPLDNTAHSFHFVANRGLAQLSRTVDLDGDGRQEVLAVTGAEGPERIAPWMLYCLDAEGAVRWRYQPGEALHFGNDSCDANWVLCADPIDLDGDGRMEIVVLSHNHYLYPAEVTLLDCRGKVLGEYVNSGWVEDVGYLDLDGDGKKEILACGCNNGYRKPVLFALQTGAVAGASPQPDNPGYRCLDRPPGREMYYLLFPRDPLAARLLQVGTLSSIALLPEQVLLQSYVGLQSPPLSGSVDYFLDARLALRRAAANSQYELIWRTLFEAGQVPRPFSPSEIQNLEPILYWDGERFVPTPTPNRHWQDRLPVSPPPNRNR